MRTTLFLAVAMMIAVGCQPSSEADNPSKVDQYDRTVLPIHPPESKSYSEEDVRNTEPPERFAVHAPEGAPNVVIVLIDDIGFGATSPFGGRIEAPTFQRLAENGVRYNQFHTTALCSPTRVALKSGRNHHVGNTGAIMELATSYPGNTGVIPESVAPLAKILKYNGYSTAAFGKWHETPSWELSVSGPFDRWPTSQGFDKFYGFIGGETNQWDPLLFDGVAAVPASKDPQYHVTTDITNNAISWMKFQNAMTPDRPFMMYFATGAVHAPHHVPDEWIERYKSKFDDGWDALRETTLAKQKAMGVVPKNAVLPPKPSDIKDWDKLSEKEKALFLLQVETYAGFMSHTDNEIGRLVGAIEDAGELDNTLIIYIMGDNGSSAEGGMTGTYNELMHLSGILDVESVDDMLSHRETWGGPESFPHMAAGWAVATSAPFSWTKQVGSDFGGTRNGVVFHWPNGFKTRGEIRSQFHHVVDIAPTVLDAAHLPEPKLVDGVPQRPMDGVSMLYSLDDGKAKTTHTTQYFEMFGNRAIYHDGWLARTIHRFPWKNEPEHAIADDVWDLYNVNEDFALANNLASKNPGKLKEMRKLFDKEAVKNHVYPIDDRSYERFDARTAGRPDLMDGRKELTLAPGMEGIGENAFINVKNVSKTITVSLKNSNKANGVVLAQGGRFGGWAVYMKNGRLGYHYNWFGRDHYDILTSVAVPAGDFVAKIRFDYDGGGAGKGGLITIKANGKTLASGRVERTQPVIFSADDLTDVGVDNSTQVLPEYNSVAETEFTGTLKHVTVAID